MTCHRYLRVLISLAGGAASLMLAVLWLRSYWYFDQLIGPVSASTFCACNSACGTVLIGSTNDTLAGVALGPNWTWESAPLTNTPDQKKNSFSFAFRRPSLADPLYSKWRFLPLFGRFQQLGGSRHSDVFLPYPFLLVVASAISIVPWLKLRFTMRSMLIGVALVATFLKYCIVLR